MKLLKRLGSILLAAVLLLQIPFSFPISGHAAWEDGMYCWYCGHYHWDEYCCGLCGACSEECTNGACYLTTHCGECGECDKEADVCLTCLTCRLCWMANGWHCLGCDECHFSSESELCGKCWFCADCMGGLCDSCGFCADCWEEENMHCVECGNCYGAYAECEFGYDHCEECCIICEQCGECLFEDGIELCDDCGLCVFCCMDNAAAEGCSCGEYCIENPDWYDHLCPDCGQAYCEVEMCEVCELCLDCCEGNSECMESPPMCVEDSDYDSHFCEDCGECFHNTDICGSCESEGLLLCEICCAIRLEAEGCDCSDRCCSDNDLAAHIAADHGNAGGVHSISPQSSWEISETHHWRACRFCNDASHHSNKAAHTYDKYGVCTVCGFDLQKNILILKQPASVVAKVSDIQTVGEEDPLYPTNNRRSFSVAAKGTSALKYQWYVRYNNGSWQALKDQPDSLTYVSGAKTNKLTVSVPVDGCVYEPSYKCVITDEKGNQVTSNVVYMKVQHVYREFKASQGALIDTIFQPGTGNNIGVYESSGHYKICVGEECDADKLEPHSFSKQTRIIYDSQSGERWVERICTQCGFKSYILDHVHYFYDPVTYECEVDPSYKNGSQHRLKCLWPGCTKTTLESHEELGWESHATPYSSPDQVGIPYKQCDICGYDTSKQLQTYSESQDKMVDSQWTQSTDLVFVEHGYASCDTVVNGSKLVIGFTPSEYAKAEYLHLKYPTVTGWRVRYYCDRGSSYPVIDIDVTKDFTFTRVGNELKWSLTVPLFSQRKGGGILTFTPIVEECKHQGGTRIKNASDPICTTDGYTGDTVCADCDGVIFYGEEIPCSGKHEGTLTLIEGTSKEGTCQQRGYEGTYRCDHCNKKVRGKSSSKQHNGKQTLKNAVAATCTEFGYSGDLYCECGVLLKPGEIIAPGHTDLRLINEVKATCMTKGYTGDWKCFTCNQIVKYGYNVTKSSHAWSTYGKVNDVYHRHTCVVNGCGASELSKHTDADRNLVCDDCGFAWGSDSKRISYIAFNIDIPAIGSTPDYTKFDGSCFASEGVSAYMKNGVQWYDVTANKRFVPSGVNQEFVEGHVYKVTIQFRTKGDYEFADEGLLTATINGRDAAVEFVTYNQFAGISYTFEALKHKHTMTRVNKVTPTCTAAGKQTYYHCSACNKYYEDAAGSKQITDLASWGNLAALGHKASELRSNSTHHFKVCTRCYQEISGSKAAHSGGTATCMEQAKCTSCGAAYGTLAGHALASDIWGFIDATGHGHLCLTENCYHRDDLLPHRSSGPATPEQDEVCLDCGYLIAGYTPHEHAPAAKPLYDGDRHWTECSCGEVLEEAAHVNDDGDDRCDVCGYLMGASAEIIPPDSQPVPSEPVPNDPLDDPDKGQNAGQKGHKLLWLYILLAVLGLGGGGFALYWFVLRKKLFIKASENPCEIPDPAAAAAPEEATPDVPEEAE